VVESDKVLDGAIIGFFSICREEAGWKLSLSPVIVQAVATESFSAAGLIGAVADGSVLFFLAFHGLWGGLLCSGDFNPGIIQLAELNSKETSQRLLEQVQSRCRG